MRGEQGGLWLAVHKHATHLLTTAATAYLAYTDVESAPNAWEIVEITCAQGPEPPAGAAGFLDPLVITPDPLAGGSAAGQVRQRELSNPSLSPNPSPTPNPYHSSGRSFVTLPLAPRA